MEPKRFSPVFCAFRIPENAVFTSRAAFLSASLKKSQNVNNVFQRKLEKSRFQEFVNKVTKPRLIPKKIALFETPPSVQIEHRFEKVYTLPILF